MPDALARMRSERRLALVLAIVFIAASALIYLGAGLMAQPPAETPTAVEAAP